jgi:hypothetical protein
MDTSVSALWPAVRMQLSLHVAACLVNTPSSSGLFVPMSGSHIAMLLHSVAVQHHVEVQASVLGLAHVAMVYG